MLATFEIRKTKKTTHGKIVVRQESPTLWGIYFYIEGRDRGFTPCRRGATIAIALAARMVHLFARQNKCKYVFRPEGGKRQLREVYVPAGLFWY